MVKYIGMDAHMSTSTFCVVDEKGCELDNTTLQTNGRLMVGYLRSIDGVKKLALEECELSGWLSEILNSEVDELMVCNPAANSEYKKNKTDKLDARRLAKLLRGGFLSPVYHDGSQRERFRSLMSGYKDLVQESVRLKNRYKSIFRRSGISVSGEGVYNKEGRLSELKRPDLQFTGRHLLQAIQHIERSLDEYKRVIPRSKRHFPELEILTSVPGIGYIQASHIISQVINPARFPNKYKYFGYCGLVRHKRQSGEREYGSRKVWGNRTLKCVYKMAGRQAVRGTSALRKYYDCLRSKGVSDKNAYNAVCRKIAAITLSVWRNNRKYDDSIVLDNLVR